MCNIFFVCFVFVILIIVVIIMFFFCSSSIYLPNIYSFFFCFASIIYLFAAVLIMKILPRNMSGRRRLCSVVTGAS